MTTLIPYKTKFLDIDIGPHALKLEVLDDLDKTIDAICAHYKDSDKEERVLEDLCPYFGVLWPSGLALAQFLAAQPELLQGKKVIEIGCGLALPSLLASVQGTQVLATDFHPDVPFFLAKNCQWNNTQVPYLCIDWKQLPSSQKFDLVLGSDILYEGKHPKEVAKVLAHFLAPGGTIILADPGRTYLQDFADLMEQSGYETQLYPCYADGTEIFLFLFKQRNR